MAFPFPPPRIFSLFFSFLSLLSQWPSEALTMNDQFPLRLSLGRSFWCFPSIPRASPPPFLVPLFFPLPQQHHASSGEKFILIILAPGCDLSFTRSNSLHIEAQKELALFFFCFLSPFSVSKSGVPLDLEIGETFSLRSGNKSSSLTTNSPLLPRGRTPLSRLL